MRAGNTLWVVELWNDAYTRRGGRWESTVGVRLTKEAAKIECRGWRQRNPNDKFRVRCYYRGGK